MGACLGKTVQTQESEQINIQSIQIQPSPRIDLSAESTSFVDVSEDELP